MPTVVVAMSGGVDSSVAALLLKQQGYNVIGLFMKNWKDDAQCTAAIDGDDVARVSDVIGIPHYTVNFSSQYRDNVFEDFLFELRAGRTPNPDILCNREIKFKVLLEKALDLNADFLATGHYCQTDNGLLLRGADSNKDQSYFLYTLKSDILKKVLFPVGHLQKPALRALARHHNIPTSEKKDSTGICFIGKRNFKEFVSNYIQYQPGTIETPEGEILGRHDGVAFYTLGQRKGLGIGGRGDAWFVVDKDLSRNALIVAQGDRHPALFSDWLTATSATWVSNPPPPRCTAKVRYRQADQLCTVEVQEDQLHVTFDRPQRAVTPGQSIVFYDGNICLGGAIIAQKGAHHERDSTIGIGRQFSRTDSQCVQG